jgi:large subunit ribosomal protein L25
MKPILTVQPRTKNKKGKSNRETILGVVYGPKQESLMIEINKVDFNKIFKEAGESTILEMQGIDKPIDVLIKEVEFSALRGGITHVDLYAVEKGKEMHAEVPLNFIGEAPATKNGAVVNKVLHEVTVTCLPQDLPNHIDVDLSGLEVAESRIVIADLTVPKGVKITQAGDEVVVMAEAFTERVEDSVVKDEVPVEETPEEKVQDTV